MKIYVSTYHKYNAGSLAGEWMDLDKYTDYKELLTDCKKLHSDEDEPEYMVQDVEHDADADWQAGYTGENLSDYADYWDNKAEAASEDSTVSAGEVRHNVDKNGVEIKFNSRPDDEILSSLKEAGWRWSRFAGVWYNRYSDDNLKFAQSIVNNSAVVETDGNQSMTGLRAIYAKLSADMKSVLNEYAQSGHNTRGIASAVKLDNGEWLTFDAGVIETKHCEGEDEGRGRSLKEAMSGCNWFKTENGFKICNNLRSVFVREGNRNRNDWRIYSNNWCILDNARNGYYTIHEPLLCREISEREWREIRRAEAWRIISLRRRVNAYWRRFGASKLRTWTYWTEA